MPSNNSTSSDTGGDAVNELVRFQALGGEPAFLECRLDGVGVVLRTPLSVSHLLRLERGGVDLAADFVCRAEGNAGVVRHGLDEDLLERAFSDDPAVGGAVEPDTPG